MAATYITAIAAYWVTEYLLRRAAYPIAPSIRLFPRSHVGQEWTLLFSPGYWLARCRKNWIDSFPAHRRLHARRRFVVASNRYNLYLSAAICVIVLLTEHDVAPGHVVQLIWALVTVRYFSRTFEIAFAFGLDVISRSQNKSGLSKYTRMQLAFHSYVELFLLSASVYYVHEIVCGQAKALTLALSVGTLTNIGYAFPAEHGPLANLVFLQVLATLSLVLLSLASYISRERKTKQSFQRTASDGD